jgi:RHS repeat-associated protein
MNRQSPQTSAADGNSGDKTQATSNAPQGPKFAVTAPSLALPKGGGAIRGMGEKFAANPVTGSGSMSVPIATSPGRAGFGPQLSLSYDSGAGNGPFGFGWSLSIPSVTRKTDKGLPRYLDHTRNPAHADVFVLSGSEDLVPVFRKDPDGTWINSLPPGHKYHRDTDTGWIRNEDGQHVVHEDTVDGFLVRRFRPRIEGLFARIERWCRIGAAEDVHWRSISKDNILTIYGADANSRIFDPADPARIFSWLICETRDDKGHGVRYLYKEEDFAVRLRPSQPDPRLQAHYQNRGLPCQRYLSRILYGNVRPLLDSQGNRPRFLSSLTPPPLDQASDWLFEVRFDYGELDEDNPATVPELPWLYRPDAFSSYRSGFEVRTCRRCERVLMLHHIPDQKHPDGSLKAAGYEGIVRSTEFAYDDEEQLNPATATAPVYSFLKRVVQAGWKTENGVTMRRAMPPVEFEYSQPVVQDEIEFLDDESLQNLPVGIDGSVYRMVDLHGEGVPGILTEQAGAWYYKRNLSPVPERMPDGTDRYRARFSPMERVALKPNVSLSAGAEFMDLAGDGLPDVVVLDGPVPGFYEHDDDEGWQPFRPLKSRVNRNLNDPNTKFIDLDGDGHADILITEDQAFVWHQSLGEDGFGPAQRVCQMLNEERGPRLVFADGTQSIYLADLSGDGQTDLVRITNSSVCYWPNLGHCRFGGRITMDNPPHFDHSDQFDHKRLRLADIDGSGTTDLIYLHSQGVRIYFNQSGNGWSEPQEMSVVPRIDDVVNIVPMDLLGNGTACLVWSSSLPGDSRQPLRYVNLMGRQKPHLLVRSVNNLGAETRVHYSPSGKFYLQDRLAGKPWITRLPFPVHVVERVETIDHISRNRFVTRYAYHHGYFDGEEREFRGFGMVEQWDTERLDAVAVDSSAAPQYLNEDAEFTQPPIHTKTWFHVGICLERGRISRLFAHEYFHPPNETLQQFDDGLLDDTPLPVGLTIAQEREACRTLKGMMLRQEVYADDADRSSATPEQIARAGRPYNVAEQNFTVRLLQPHGDNPHAVFCSHPVEALTFHYERNPADPRVQHALTLDVDAFGNVLKQAAIGYGRKFSPLAEKWDRDQQTTALLTYTENRVTNAVDSVDTYRTPLPCEAITYELTEFPATGPAGRYRVEDLIESDPIDHNLVGHRFNPPEVPYEDAASGSRRRRPIEHLRTYYRPNDLGGATGDASRLLKLGQVESLALQGESYKLAFTPRLLSKVYQRSADSNQPPDELMSAVNRSQILGGQGGADGGYVDLDGNGHWWLPSGRSFFSSDPSDSPVTELANARDQFFIPRRIRDAFGHSAIVEFDSFDLLMAETRDPLNNRVTVEINDYRVLHPRLMSDPNRNRSEVAFDLLGMVVGTAVMGKAAPSPEEGDSLSDFQPDPGQNELDAFFSCPAEANPADPKRSRATNATHNLLKGATSRIVYDVDRFFRSRQANPDNPALWQPAVAATIARETHLSDLPKDALGRPTQQSKLQISFSYSDGFGREIQKKIQAEPGRLDPLDNTSSQLNPRWVGSGWTVFNNKGKPVRQYEPFFSATQGFEFGVAHGVSPVLFYDPADRVVATLHPNHTFEKVVFDPWQQTTWDVNDTCAARNAQTGDPRTDPDIGGYVAAYFETQPPAWQTWHAQRIGNALGDDERNAAERAAAHADTPTAAHFDSLGRPFLTMARNRVVCDGHDLDGTEESFATRVELDIEGNQLAVRDAIQQAGDPLGRIVMRYAYDMLGNRIHQLSMEAGARWMLNDVAGKPIRAWDSRGHNFRTAYDALRRPVEQYVRGTFSDADPLKPNSDPRTLNRDMLVDRIVYGEPPLNATPAQETEAQRLNLRTRIYQHADSAGIATNARLHVSGNPTEAYDFKGNLLRSTRQLVSDYKAIPDWLLNPQLDAETFEGSTRYDALNRAIQSVAPNSSLMRPGHPNRINVIQPVYSEANLLERVDVWLERGAEPAGLLDPASDVPSPVGVADIDYDAKGQRQWIAYKNGASTFYSYDPLTFRLTQLMTRRKSSDFPGDDPPSVDPAWPGKQVQNLSYTYDPAGNITHIEDAAQQTIYFKNNRVEPSNDYVYDALYRLIQADGREHLGQVGGSPIPNSHTDAPRVGLQHPGDGQAMGTYTERYVYDAVGNFLQMQHRGSDPAHPGWTCAYNYAEASLTEPGKRSNRLSSTQVGNGIPAAPETYLHDAHGNMLRMPPLGSGSAGPNMHWDYKDQLRQVDMGGGGAAFYVYDASGQRVRKVWEKNNGNRIEERIYLGGFEIFRSHNGPIGTNTATLERETLHVMDDKQRIALVETRTFDTAGSDQSPRQLIRYQIGNHLGSASLELDESAQIISYEEFAPYGSSTYQAVRSQTETAKRYRYTGKEHNDESGLYYHGARYYAGWLGRWTNCDPIGVADGPCVYMYCSANPIRLHDPSGKKGAQPLPGLIGNDPKLGKLWEQAVVDTLGSRFKASTYKETIEGFKAELGKRIAVNGRGSNTQAGSGIKYARDSYKAVRTRFGELAADAEIDLEGLQVHHTFDELAKNPEGALDITNLSLVRGNAGTKGSGHNFAHEVTKAAEKGIKNPGQHVAAEMRAKGIEPDVPELGRPHTKAATPAPNVEAAPSAAKPVAPAVPEPTVKSPSPAVAAESTVMLPKSKPPSAGTLLLAEAAEAGVVFLKFAGHVTTVYGAHNMAARNASEYQGPLEKVTVYGGTFLWAAGAGFFDDALGALETPMMGAPVTVMNSWEQKGAGPTQVLVSDLLQKLYRW